MQHSGNRGDPWNSRFAGGASRDKPGRLVGTDGKPFFYFGKMVFLRALDEKAMHLQRSGRIGFYIGAAGQEAAEIGSGFALSEGDWVFPSYRDQGVALLHGYPLSALVGQLFGNSSDATRGRQMPNHWCDRSARIVSVSSPVATQLPQAVGAA
jgi:2-oxoisovalerate dehydrogenase E1 component alpha subunit